MTIIASSIYSTTLTEWYTNQGKMGTSLLEIGIFPLLVSAALFIAGLYMIITYFKNLKQS